MRRAVPSKRFAPTCRDEASRMPPGLPGVVTSYAGAMAQHGRYKIQRRVADGGMAEIFLATQMGREGFQKPVILKRINSAIYADPQFRNMFIDEAHISMSLSHSNIAQVLDLG